MTLSTGSVLVFLYQKKRLTSVLDPKYTGLQSCWRIALAPTVFCITTKDECQTNFLERTSRTWRKFSRKPLLFLQTTAYRCPIERLVYSVAPSLHRDNNQTYKWEKVSEQLEQLLPMDNLPERRARQWRAKNEEQFDHALGDRIAVLGPHRQIGPRIRSVVVVLTLCY